MKINRYQAHKKISSKNLKPKEKDKNENEKFF